MQETIHFMITIGRTSTRNCLLFVSACNAQPPVGAVGVMQLSEPLLWFILRVLDKESALEQFNRMGGVKVCIK